jgi:hypothetical protein
VLDADANLSEITARHALAWTAEEEAQRLRLEQERNHVLSAEAEGRVEPGTGRAAVRAHDERAQLEHGAFLERRHALRVLSSQHKLARVIDAESDFLVLLQAAPQQLNPAKAM